MTSLPALLLVTAALPCNQDLAGHWEGSMVREDRTYEIRIDITHADGVDVARLDLPGYLIYDCPVELEIEHDAIVLRPALIDGEIRATLANDRLVGTASIVAPESRITLEQRGSQPARLNHEEIRFRSGDAERVGTLVTPPGDGPFPVIVWTHGSGPDTRRTFCYHSRAHLLARHGVAGLIYDKRGSGESTGSGAWKLDLLVEDAIAAVRAIRNRRDIDEDRIGIAGFSQGGWVAPDVARRCTDVDFVVVGATPGITMGEQNAFTALNALRAAEYNADDANAASELLLRLYRFYQTGDDRDGVVGAMESARAEKWYDEPAFQRNLFLPGGELPVGVHPYWEPFSPDPTELWRSVKVPVLSMWGELDRQVPADRSRTVIRAALESSGHTDASLIVFPGASHGFWIVRGEDEPWDWPRQTPECVSTMVEWVLSHTRPQRRVVPVDP